MKKIIILFTIYILPLVCFAQVNEIKFNLQNINFSAAPRTSISPMSMKLWDNYNNGGPTSYGTVMEIYGLGGHQTSQLYFGGWDNSKIRYREAFYGLDTWSNWITMLDSKNDVESAGNLKITGNANSYILNGNLGIGTNNPNATLQIGDSNGSGSPTSEIEIKRLSLAPVTHSGSDWFFTARDNTPYANLDIGYSNNKTMTLRHDGNVGIGTTNPTSKLTVAGNINSREVKVTVDAGADFVFEKGYDLPSLTTVEKFINENKHLPEIASAKEMQKDGINLSEMNIKLLQKIEELTLYLIEQSKEIELLKNDNKSYKLLSNRMLELENKK